MTIHIGLDQIILIMALGGFGFSCYALGGIRTRISDAKRDKIYERK